MEGNWRCPRSEQVSVEYRWDFTNSAGDEKVTVGFRHWKFVPTRRFLNNDVQSKGLNAVVILARKNSPAERSHFDESDSRIRVVLFVHRHDAADG